MDVSVTHWKENFDELESTTRNEAWTKIASSVSIFGTNKTLKYCKGKIRNLLELCCFHSSFFKFFILHHILKHFMKNCHDGAMVMPYLKEVGLTNQKAAKG